MPKFGIYYKVELTKKATLIFFIFFELQPQNLFIYFSQFLQEK